MVFQCHELQGTSGRAAFNAERHNATSTAPIEYERLLPVSELDPKALPSRSEIFMTHPQHAEQLLCSGGFLSLPLP